VVKLDERLPAGRLTLEQAAPRLKQLFWEQRRNAALRGLVPSLRKNVAVETFQ
jgi:hypothetical protein